MYQTGNKCYEEKIKQEKGATRSIGLGEIALLQKVAREGHFRQGTLEQNPEMRESCRFLEEEDSRQREKQMKRPKIGEGILSRWEQS